MAFLLEVGCGGPGPVTYPVSGKVTWQGKSVPTGSVMFVPDSGPAAVGTIARDGTYRLHAVAGKHRVGVTAIPPPPEGMREEYGYMVDPLVPARFNRPESSGLMVEVQPEKENTADLDLR